MDFITLDIKTANRNKNSVCFIEILVIKNNIVYERLDYFIRPKYFEFDDINKWIYGIREEDFRDKKEFNEVWEEINKYFNKTLVVVHNASFEIAALREVLKLYEIEITGFNFICTSKLFRKVYYDKNIVNIKDINKFLDSEKGDEPINEAVISKDIMINVLDRVGSKDIGYLSRKIGIRIGEVGEDYYKPCLALYKDKKVGINKNEDDKTKCSEVYSNDEVYSNINKNSFVNEVVVFTRGLSSMKRYEAMEQVRRYGGTTSGTVNKGVTTLVVGVKDVKSISRRDMSTKHRKAIDLNEKGQGIVILNEEEFLEKLNKIKLNL